MTVVTLLHGAGFVYHAYIKAPGENHISSNLSPNADGQAHIGDLPDEVPQSYTIQDVALFSARDEDYPGFARNTDMDENGIGYPRQSYTTTSNYLSYFVNLIASSL